MSFPSDHGAGSSSSSHPPQPCRQFSLPEIELATRNFDKSRLLGSGGFADVYKGAFTYGKKLLNVAIKRLRPRPCSSEGASGFWYEVEMLSKLKHPNLVSLIGYCSDGQEMILVYDYMPVGTLEHLLHKGGFPLSWIQRLKICLEVASGLAYLHDETDTKSMVLHLDVKSSNILLASNWAAKLSDFGMSKVRPLDSAYFTNNVGGTLGYLDPHFQQNGKASRKTDVFAFGVVMLEVLCRKKAYTNIDGVLQFLRAWAQDSIKSGRLKQNIDPDLKGQISSKCLKKFAVLADNCLHSRPEQRPTMAKVMKDLESILSLHKKADIASSEERSDGGITLKSLDRYLYSVGGGVRIVPRFNFNALVQATENFSEANKLLSDGYYEFIYKGRLQCGQDITVAKFLKDAYKECKDEASVLVEIENENVIQLLGYCIDSTNVYLLYEFAFITTLAGLIFDPECDVLDWNVRHKIILGVAKGLVYLHNQAPSPIIHVNVQPENILLDQSFEPKLSGFGFAYADGDFDFWNRLPWCRGTFGYRPPDFKKSWPTTKVDVYSFGVLVLNTVTGQKAGPKDTEYWLVDYVRGKKEEGKLLDVIDPRINNADSTLMIKVMEIGLLCVQGDYKARPTMEEVVGMLLGTLPLDD